METNTIVEHLVSEYNCIIRELKARKIELTPKNSTKFNLRLLNAHLLKSKQYGLQR